jgi:hypothetical protein
MLRISYGQTIAITAGLALLVACGGQDSDCQQGATQPCVCTDGAAGAQVCEQARWSPCECQNGCQQGATQACVCTDGASGAQTCTGATWGSCECRAKPQCTSGARRDCSCGKAQGFQTCIEGTWAACECAGCVPMCGARVCGPDPTCGTSCGSCASGSSCDTRGQCVCSPSCGARVCGPDPVCGSSCGTCSSESSCDAQGQCVRPPSTAPIILSIQANSNAIDPTVSLKITAVVTDPDGIDDLIGGTLDSPSGASYGAFATAAAEGSYEITLSWHDLNTVEAINAPPAGTSRTFVATFFDVGGHKTVKTVSILLRCDLSGFTACAGKCFNLTRDASHCGACGHDCGPWMTQLGQTVNVISSSPSCLDSICTATVHTNNRRSCAAYCASAGQGCNDAMQYSGGAYNCPAGDKGGACARYDQSNDYRDHYRAFVCADQPGKTYSLGQATLTFEGVSCQCTEP